jgi:hypothetical protein
VIFTASILLVYVTRQGTNVKLSDDDTNIETCRSIYYVNDNVVIYTVVILIVYLLVVKTITNAWYMHQNKKILIWLG